MTTKFTPGPWSVEVETERGCCGEDIGIEITIPEINRLLHSTEWADSEDWDRDLANAHLIAAAPEMYEALQSVLPHLLDETQQPLAEAIRLVLAKAEGGAR